MSAIRIAKDLNLPIEAATQTFLIVGKRGSGKTTTCVRLAEQFFSSRIPFVVVDPVDSWWGLKASRDGKGPGLGVYVFGGKHADAPIEPTAGALIADVLVEHRISSILSVKHFSGRERGRFVADFAYRLFQKNTAPLHVFLEEAHEVAPQNPFKGEEEMLGHVTRIWKLGRSSGLGGSAVTQRPASLSKNITTQAEILIVHRTIGPQDVAAIREWIKYHGEREDILAQLSTLKTGEAFIWAPDFPEGNPIGLRRISVLDRETFDSSATPKMGHKGFEPKALAPVDLEGISKKMAATIERAKAEDPRELRKNISALEREILEAKKTLPPPEKIEVPVLKGEQLERAEKLAKDMLDLADKMTVAGEEMTAEIRKATKRPVASIPRPQPARSIAQSATPAPAHRSHRVVQKRDAADPGAITPVQQRILNGLAELEQLGAREPARELVAFLAGYSNLQSKGFVNGIGALRSSGLIDYPATGTVVLTEAGRAAAQYPERPRSAEEVQARVINLLGGASSRILRPLIEAYPEALPREEVAQQAGYGNLQSKGFVNAIGRLRTLGFIDYPDRGTVRAQPVLFLEGR